MASKLTKVVANFETSLASKLSFAATTGSLSNVTDKNGVALPTGKYCMILNRGTSNEEHLLFTLTGSAMTQIVSVSRQGVQTVGVQNPNGHRVGVACFLTDFVNLKVIVDILNGVDTIDATTPLQYDANPTFTDSKQLVSKGYVDAQVALFIANLLSGNNVFTGNNTFTGSTTLNGPTVTTTSIKGPDPVTSDDLATRAFVLAQAFGSSLIAGLNSPEINYRPDGLVRSVHDNDNGKTYVFVYDEATFQLEAIQDGTNEWAITYNSDGVVQSIYKH